MAENSTENSNDFYEYQELFRSFSYANEEYTKLLNEAGENRRISITRAGQKHVTPLIGKFKLFRYGSLIGMGLVPFLCCGCSMMILDTSIDIFYYVFGLFTIYTLALLSVFFWTSTKLRRLNTLVSTAKNEI